MTQKITCDACGKDHFPEETYDFKIKSRNSKQSLVFDVCQPCFLKTVEGLGVQKIWKKWNQNLKVYEKTGVEA